MNIGNQIQMLRKQNNITQETLACEMGVSIAAVSKWENGNSMPDIVMLCALADFFQVTTDELLGRNRREDFIICDDAELICEVLQNILEKEGYRNIIVTSSGEQLLAALNKKTPYAVFLDINLPDNNGLELLQKIKAYNSKIKVFMVTADDTARTKEKAAAYGADAYITKPFLPEHIKLVLKEQLPCMTVTAKESRE